jgi:hypothetical protein
MFGFESFSEKAISEVITGPGSSEFPAFLPSMNSLLGGVPFTSPIGGFEAPYAFSLGMFGIPTGGAASIIPQIIWHLRQQGNS